MKIAILGGTFNPPHIGHLFLAEEVRCAFGYNRIIIVPAHLPAHKEVAAGISAAHRLAMCRAAVGDDPAFTVDDCEIRRGGVSYMVETVTDIVSRYAPESKPGLIIGDDLCAGLPGWKNASRLARMTRIILVHWQRVERVEFALPHVYFNNRILPLSSSEIRIRIKHGQAVRFLVPPAVFAYIEAKALYRG